MISRYRSQLEKLLEEVYILKTDIKRQLLVTTTFSDHSCFKLTLKEFPTTI